MAANQTGNMFACAAGDFVAYLSFVEAEIFEDLNKCSSKLK